MKKTLTAILAIALALGAVATSCTDQPTTNGGTAGPPEVGKLAPDFELDTLDGQPVSLSELKGKAVLVNFWATWCGPCRMEMPFIQQIYDEWQGKGLVLLAINIGERPSQVAEFMQGQGLSFPVLLDSNGKVTERYYVTGIPTTFFIDKDGIIQYIKVGLFQSKAEIESSLSKLK